MAMKTEGIDHDPGLKAGEPNRYDAAAFRLRSGLSSAAQQQVMKAAGHLKVAPTKGAGP